MQRKKTSTLCEWGSEKNLGLVTSPNLLLEPKEGEFQDLV